MAQIKLLQPGTGVALIASSEEQAAFWRKRGYRDAPKPQTDNAVKPGPRREYSK